MSNIRSFDLSEFLVTAENVIEADFREVDENEPVTFNLTVSVGQMELLQDVLVNEIGQKFDRRHYAPEMVRDLIKLAKATKTARAS